MMIECALSVLKSLNHQDISRVIIPFARVVYLLTLSVNANPRNPVWVFDVLCVVCTPWVMENLINQRNGQNVSQSMTLFRKLLINQTKYIVNHAWEKMKRKRLRTIVYHTRSICVNNALSIIGEIWHL